ncbi:MAG: hypothetical protein IJF05_06775 [Clostridia bacterium]|nr:hypothetical protein [Clostridia bacterium]
MTYESAVKIIEAEFDTIADSIHNKVVMTGLTYDGYKPFCVSVYDDGENVIITNLGETKEVFDEITES